jgi:uncharacterized protein YlaN (UPF0358 family)
LIFGTYVPFLPELPLLLKALDQQCFGQQQQLDLLCQLQLLQPLLLRLLLRHLLLHDLQKL